MLESASFPCVFLCFTMFIFKTQGSVLPPPTDSEFWPAIRSLPGVFSEPKRVVKRGVHSHSYNAGRSKSSRVISEGPPTPNLIGSPSQHRAPGETRVTVTL